MTDNSGTSGRENDDTSLTSGASGSAPSAADVLLNLAERCESEEPSRMLDAEITVALNIIDVAWARPNSWLWIDTRASISYGEPVIRMTDQKKRHAGDSPLKTFGHFTTSLDCAVTLRPDGREWAAEEWEGRAFAHIRLRHLGTIIDSVTTVAKTPALALCAASLKARAALVQS